MTRQQQVRSDLEKRVAEIKSREQALTLEMLAHLRNCNQVEAKRSFELSLEWNALRHATCSLINATQEDVVEQVVPPTFVVSAWFLRDLVKCLTPRKDEEIAYVTGVSIGNGRVLSRICGVRLEEQSVVYARATGRSCSDSLIEILENGLRLHLVAHSHPGTGPSSTHQSSTDINYLGRIQKNGSEAIGAIVNRDGYVRFWTVHQDFEIEIEGKGVTHVEDTVVKLT